MLLEFPGDPYLLVAFMLGKQEGMQFLDGESAITSTSVVAAAAIATDGGHDDECVVNSRPDPDVHEEPGAGPDSPLRGSRYHTGEFSSVSSSRGGEEEMAYACPSRGAAEEMAYACPGVTWLVLPVVTWASSAVKHERLRRGAGVGLHRHLPVPLRPLPRGGGRRVRVSR